MVIRIRGMVQLIIAIPNIKHSACPLSPDPLVTWTSVASAQLRAALSASRPSPMASVELSAHSAELHFLCRGAGALGESVGRGSRRVDVDEQ